MLSATTNTAALTAQRYLDNSSSAASSSIAKMSSGSRIVKASDDASSLAIGNKLRADIASLEQAGRNASQGASLLQVANGAITRIGDILIRMKTLATQVVNGTLSVAERQYAQQEFTQLTTQIDQIATQTRWNNVSMLNGGDKTVASKNSLGSNIASGTVGRSAGAGTYFANNGAGGSIVNVTGNVQGSVTDVRVTDLGTSQFKLQIDVGGQTFTGFASAASTGSIRFTSETNNHSSFDVNLTAALPAVSTVNAGTLDTELSNQLLLTSTTSPAVSVSSAALTQANIETALGVTFANNGVKATGATADGIYHVTSRYDSTTSKLTLRLHKADTNETFDSVVEFPTGVAATDVKTMIFGNGLEIRMTGTVLNALNTTNIADGVRINVTQGTATTMQFQVGEKSTDLLAISFVAMTAQTLGLSSLNIETLGGGQTASGIISDAISKVNRSQAQLGAIQSRMEYVESNIATITENLTAAKGIFLDVDMAAEMTEFTKQQTLMQAGVAMLAQANQMPQQLLRLIQG